jgi:hypothetical protein
MPLKSIIQGKTANNNQILRWLMYLQQFQIEIQYVEGTATKHAIPDALSRQYEGERTEIANIRFIHPIPHIEALRKAQAEDPFSTRVKATIRNEESQEQLTTKAENFIKRHITEFWIEDDILYHEEKGQRQIVLPYELRAAICHTLHALPMAAHLGYEKTLERIKRFYFWRTMATDIKNFCDDCKHCARNKNGQMHKGKIQKPEIPQEPFDKISCDIVGPLTATKQYGVEYTHILTILCCFTKFAIAIPIPNLTAETTADILYNQVFCIFGIPEEVSTDNGRNFVAQLLQDALKLLNIQQIFTSRYSPRSNQVERFHGTLNTMLRHYINEKPSSWIKFLQSVTFAYNTAKQTSSKYSPFELLYGREARQPGEVALHIQKCPYIDEEDYLTKMTASVQLARKVAHHNLQEAQEKSNQTANRKRKQTTIAEGDRVMLKVPFLQSKSQQKFTGPYRVVKRQSETSVLITPIDATRKEPQAVHVDRLKV